MADNPQTLSISQLSSEITKQKTPADLARTLNELTPRAKELAAQGQEVSYDLRYELKKHFPENQKAEAANAYNDWRISVTSKDPKTVAERTEKWNKYAGEANGTAPEKTPEVAVAPKAETPKPEAPKPEIAKAEPKKQEIASQPKTEIHKSAEAHAHTQPKAPLVAKHPEHKHHEAIGGFLAAQLAQDPALAKQFAALQKGGVRHGDTNLPPTVEEATKGKVIQADPAMWAAAARSMKIT